jgi:hypothetical protein
VVEHEHLPLAGRQRSGRSAARRRSSARTALAAVVATQAVPGRDLRAGGASMRLGRVGLGVL